MVWAVVHTLGFNALYHDDVWTLWQHPLTRVAHTRVSGDPSLDLLLPFLGNICNQLNIAHRPPSALATLSLAACTSDDRLRALDVASWFCSSAAQAIVCKPVVSDAIPSKCAKVYRSLAILDTLIGKAPQRHASSGC